MAEPLQQWVHELKQEISPHMASVHALNELADKVRPIVLIVDDDALQRKLVASILNAENYQLLFASNGIEALTVLRRTRPDAVLMDFMMPEMDGIEATRRLKTLPQVVKLPVVMTTGKSEDNIVTGSLKAGATDFLVKPFQRDTLLAKLRQVLARVPD